MPQGQGYGNVLVDGLVNYRDSSDAFLNQGQNADMVSAFLADLAVTANAGFDQGLAGSLGSQLQKRIANAAKNEAIKQNLVKPKAPNGEQAGATPMPSLNYADAFAQEALATPDFGLGIRPQTSFKYGGGNG